MNSRRVMRGLLIAFSLQPVALPAAEEETVFAQGESLKLVIEKGAGEGPAWHPKLGLLASFGDIWLHPPGGESRVYREKIGSNGLLFDRQGRLLACQPSKRRVIRFETDGKITVLTDTFRGQPYNQPNDLTLDAKNRIYFTDPKYGPRNDLDQRDASGRAVEGVYRIDLDGTVTRIITHEVDRPNGIVVSADDQYLFVADNNNNTVGGSRRLYRFRLNGDGSVKAKSRKLLFDWKDGRGPDGMVLDQSGRLFVAGGRNRASEYETVGKYKGGVYVFTPSGRLIDFVEVPADEVTNCTFGGSDLKTLFVTAGGRLYRIRVTVPGWLPFPTMKSGL